MSEPHLRRPFPAVQLVVLLIGLALLLSGSTPLPALTRAPLLSYLVVARTANSAGAHTAARAARAAGGTIRQLYPPIGVVLAYASGEDFSRQVRVSDGVWRVGASRTAPMRTPPQGPSRTAVERAVPDPVPGVSRTARQPRRQDSSVRAVSAPQEADPARGTPWNLKMLGGHATAGPTATRHPVVAVLDSGVDDTHPDLRGVVDPARSTSCANGSPNSDPGAWRPPSNIPESGHGTHISGTVAARKDGRGVTGVAPGARIAAVRLLSDTGQYYGENLVCGFLWAASHGARVVNDSYFADPWKYNCPGAPDQLAVLTAVRRAVHYAQRHGALIVASAGNDGVDLHGTHEDARSPNDHPPAEQPATRILGPSCIRIPSQLPDVLKVTALDAQGGAAGYSNYDGGPNTVAAPGGDPNASPAGQVVSTWPGGVYRALSGTSMAAAHVSGVAAVLAARHPGASAARLRHLILDHAVRRRCTEPRPASQAASCADSRTYGRTVRLGSPPAKRTPAHGALTDAEGADAAGRN